jgi:methyltransferase family protein
MTSITPDFRYWNSVDPAHFLEHDWQNPSRVWATAKAIGAAKNGTLLEVGPGPGVDYERHFAASGVPYVGWEGSTNLCKALRFRFPEATWVNGDLSAIPAALADVVYARHVMEHQPALDPALGWLLGAARGTVVLTWYRPPDLTAYSDYWEGVHCHTFARADVLQAIERHGFRIMEQQTFASGDETWVLVRT